MFPKKPQIAVVGYGEMGRALVTGLLGPGGVQPEQLKVLVRRIDDREASKQPGVRVTTDPVEATESCDIVFLCTKSIQASTSVRVLAKSIPTDRTVLVVSLCAGLPTAALEENLVDSAVVIKAIANIGIMTGDGFTVAYSRRASEKEMKAFRGLFDPLGSLIIADSEAECDVVSTFSATIPSFISTTLSALVDAGVYGGISRSRALEVATAVMLGTAKSVSTLMIDPEIYRRKIASPGGVVIRGAQVLEMFRVRAAYVQAMATVFDSMAGSSSPDLAVSDPDSERS